MPEVLIADMANTTSYDRVKLKNEDRQNERRRQAIQQFIGTSKQKPSDARIALEKTLKYSDYVSSIGESVANTIIPAKNKKVKEALATDINVAIGSSLNSKAIVKNIGKEGLSYKQAMETPESNALLAAQALTKNHPKEAKKLATEWDPDTFSWKDYINFFNPIGDDAPDGHDFDFYKMGEDILSGDFEYDEFDKNMESNYGKDWEMRFAGFLAKEAVVDLSIIAAVRMVPFLAPIIAYNQATALVRIGAAVSRATLFAAGGTAAQVVQHDLIDRDTNIPGELIGRFTGSLGADAIGYGVRGAYRKITGATKKEAIKKKATEMGTKPLTEDEFKKIISVKQFETSEGAGLVRARLFADVENYQKTMNRVSSDLIETTNKLSDAPLDIKEGLATFIGRDVTELDDLPMDLAFNHIKDMEIASAKLAEDTLKGMDNDSLISKGLIYHILGKAAGEYENLSKTFKMYFSDTNVLLRETDGNYNEAAIPALENILKAGGIADPSAFGQRSGSNLTTGQNFGSKIANGFQRIYKDATKGLTNKEFKELDAMLQEGAHKGVVFDNKILSPESVAKVSPKLYKAYAKLRIGLDLTHEILDASQTAASKGTIKNLTSGKNVTGKIFKTKDNEYHIVQSYTDGKVITKSFDRNSFSAVDVKGYKTPKVSDLMEIDTIVPYSNGYVPRTYASQSRSVIVLNKKGMKLEKRATFNTRGEAEKYAERLRKENPNEIAIVSFSNSATGFGGVTTNRNTIDAFAGLAKDQREVLLEQLKGFGIDGNNLRKVIKNLDIPHVTKKASKKPTDLGIATTKLGQEARAKISGLRYKAEQSGIKAKEATTKKEIAAHTALEKYYNKQIFSIISRIKKLPANKANPDEVARDISIYNELQVPTQSIVEYMAMVAQNAGQANWRTMAIDHWHTKYGNALTIDGSWRTAKESLMTKKINPQVGLTQKEIADAVRMSKWIQRHVSRTSAAEKKYNTLLATTEERLAEAAQTSKIAAATLKIFEKAPLAYQINATLRGIAAIPKLLWFVPAQTFVQSAQAISTIGIGLFTNPAQITKSLFRMPILAGIAVAEQTKFRLPRSITNSSNYKVYKELVQSGYVADLATVDTLFMLKHKYNPSPITAGMDLVKKAGLAPFRLGEGANRVMAYVAVRDAFASAIRAGKKDVLDFDGRVMTVADIGTHQFREAVVEKAKVMALDMSKSGELELMSGFGSVLFQFKQVLPKQASLFASGQLTAMEKLGSLSAMVGVWGPTAVLFAPDVLKFTDWINYEIFSNKSPNERFIATDKARAFADWLAGHAEDKLGMPKETADRLLKYGALAAATDGEVMLSNRIALGHFLADMVDVNDLPSMIVSYSVLMDMVDAAKKLGAFGAAEAILNPFSWFEIHSRVLSGQDFRTALANEFDPETVIGKAIQGDVELGSLGLETLRALGRVFPVAGGLSRSLDAANKHLVNPEAFVDDPYYTPYYRTKGFSPTDVKANTTRDIMSVFGITPGKIVEAQNKKQIERIYKKAVSEYQRKIDKRVAMASNMGSKGMNSIIREYQNEMYAFKTLMVELGLDVPVANNLIKTGNGKFLKNLLNFTGSGGKN